MSPLYYAVGASGHSQMTVQRYKIYFICANKNAEILHLIVQSLVFPFPECSEAPHGKERWVMPECLFRISTPGQCPNDHLAKRRSNHPTGID